MMDQTTRMPAPQSRLGGDSARLLSTLEQLLEIEATDLRGALDHASDLLASALRSDKVDVFLLEPETTSLVAQGTSKTPMGMQQHQAGLERMPVANGGRAVEVYTTGQAFITGRADEDPNVLPGIKDTLGVRSMLLVPLHIGGDLRGVVSAVSAAPDHYSPEDLQFLGAVSRWVGTVAQHAELVERIKRLAVEEARRTTGEELVAVLAHDMGNRITPVLGRLDMIRRNALRDGHEKYLRDADAAMQATQNLQALVDDLLDVSRLEQGIFSLSLQPVNLSALAGDAVELFRVRRGAIDLRVPGEVRVEADPARIGQVLENLLANAVKHSPEGTPITVEVDTSSREDGRWAVITVRDQGPGISAEVMPRIFTPFSVGPGSGGLGLGLFLAQGIARAHNGALTVESEPGLGAAFTLSLPVTQAQAPSTS